MKEFFKCALITGASSGIGEALAQLLSSRNISLILTGRDAKRLEAVALKVGAKKSVVADLQKREERGKIITLIREEIPDLVINNAGLGFYGEALSLSVDEQLAELEVDAAAPLELTLVAAKTLISAGQKGVILNVSSVAGDFPTPGMSVYGASKAFLTSLSRSFNTEMASKGVHVLVSCPGMVATDFANRAAKKRVDLSGGPVLSAEFAAQQIWKQIERRKEKHIFNWQYRLGSWLAHSVVPISLVKNIVWTRIKKRL